MLGQGEGLLLIPSYLAVEKGHLCGPAHEKFFNHPMADEFLMGWATEMALLTSSIGRNEVLVVWQLYGNM